MTDGCGRTIDYLRLSVTDRCNFRCRYCMPEEGVCKREHRDMLTLEELAEVAAACVRCGVKKIRLTGRRAPGPPGHRGAVPSAAGHSGSGRAVPHHQRLSPAGPGPSPAGSGGWTG